MFSTLNKYSPQKIEALNNEVFERVKLCERCGGIPHMNFRTVRLNNGLKLALRTVKCFGGKCEICGKMARGYELMPHEINPRSLGGKVSLSNSKMVCLECHRKVQGKHDRPSKLTPRT